MMHTTDIRNSSVDQIRQRIGNNARRDQSVARSIQYVKHIYLDQHTCNICKYDSSCHFVISGPSVIADAEQKRVNLRPLYN